LKLSGIARLSFAVSFFLLSQYSSAQVSPVRGGLFEPRPTTWDIFAGGSYERAIVTQNTATNIYGWDAAVSEYPYRAHRWLGGTIDVTGHYYDQSGLSAQVYTFMGGPSLALRDRGIQPFVRVLAGSVLVRSSQNSAASTVSNYFGLAAGGGVDVPVHRKLAVRGQADWVPYWVQGDRGSLVRASGGVVLKF
jgi:hypothetical protein